MLVVPQILRLEPQNTIVIVPNPGSVLGVSDTYNMIVKLSFAANSSILVNWKLTIVNANFYRFGDRQAIWAGQDEIRLAHKELSIPFVIQNIVNIGESTPPIEIELYIFEDSDPGSARTTGKWIKVSYEPAEDLERNFLI